MSESRTKQASRVPRSCSEPLPPESKLTLPEVLQDARQSLHELVLSKGLEVFAKMLEDDRTALCGPKHRPQGDRVAYRYGHDEGQQVLGGRKVRLRKPRVRSVTGRELELPTWREMNQEDPLNQRVIEQMLVGVSTRNYGRSLEPLPAAVPITGTSRSAVSRHFVASTRSQVEKFLSRRLDDLDLPVIMLDGTGMGEHVLVVALGIDAKGHKHVLGVTEGSTESEQVCRGLLRNLIERGLTVERARLFVIDGGKGLRKAIRETFGDWALIQRCQVHKLRNVVEQLPQGKRTWVRAAMNRAWLQPTAAGARSKLRELAAQLAEQHPSAARSILEGLDETLTVIGLGLGSTLAKTMRSTNPIENLQGTLKRVARNVKRWRGGSMALRWAVSGLLEAQKRFRRVKGYREMPQLIAALEATVRCEAVDTKAKIA
jgi:putative transposase